MCVTNVVQNQVQIIFRRSINPLSAKLYICIVLYVITGYVCHVPLSIQYINLQSTSIKIGLRTSLFSVICNLPYGVLGCSLGLVESFVLQTM